MPGTINSNSFLMSTHSLSSGVSTLLPNVTTLEPTLRTTEPIAPGPKKYLIGLDSLRAIAALSVCLFHFTGGMLSKLSVPSLQHCFLNGYLGVEMFFVISGFIIPYSLVNKGHRATDFFTYLKKRILRITPPAYISLALILSQWAFIDLLVAHDRRHLDSLSWGQIVNNMLFTIPFTHYKWIGIVFWTLAVEFQFYIFIGFLFNRLFNRPLVWFFGIYALVMASSLLPHAEALKFLHFSVFFALGGLVLLRQQGRLSTPTYLAGLLISGAFIYWQLDSYEVLVGIGTALAINLSTFRIPGFSLIGKISYSLYLTHAIFGTTAEFVLVRIFHPSSDTSKVVLTAVCLGLTIGGSYLFYRAVEQPFMRLASQNRG
ncbi:MAG: acyltransferase family protein [Janthinobacterium lividum]